MLLALALLLVVASAGVIASPAADADDVPTCEGRPATILGTEGDDTIVGTRRADVIVGLGGNDELSGGGGDDVICGGDGDDTIRGNHGADRLYGDGGRDRLLGGPGGDILSGGGGNDAVTGSGGNDELDGGPGNDSLYGSEGRDVLLGGPGNDRLRDDSGPTVMEGGPGNDRLFGGPRRDRLSGDAGDDRLSGNGGSDTLDGGLGSDTVDGGDGKDVCSGGEAVTGCEDSTPGALPEAQAATPRVFAYYYLWWSDRHWRDKLGPAYPHDAEPLPMPASLDASGCEAVSHYEGNQLFDVPDEWYSQDDPGVIEKHVRQAAAAGISGFIVNWSGTGDPDQVDDDISYSRRLAEMFAAVQRVNADGIPFRLWISYKASAKELTLEHILGDWQYLAGRYGDNPALDDRYGDRPVIVWMGSRKYPTATLEAVAAEFRDDFYIVGDENWKTWDPERAAFLDGDQYYWSSQNPNTNPHSFDQLEDLASMVRSSGPNPDGSPKTWFAPFTPGYNSRLLGGSSCVPRDDGATMAALLDGNARSNPDDWVLISWNEIAEGTYVEPLQRWGTTYLDHVTRLAG